MSAQVSFKDGNLIVTKTYGAPREAVFEAWIATSKVEKWWGCDATTAVRSEIEPRVGGAFNHAMTVHGQEMDIRGCFTEYDPPARLAYSAAGPDGGVMTVSVDFSEVEGGTRVRLVHAGIPDTELPDGRAMRDIIGGGWSAALRKLGALLGAPAGQL